MLDAVSVVVLAEPFVLHREQPRPFVDVVVQRRNSALAPGGCRERVGSSVAAHRRPVLRRSLPRGVAREVRGPRRVHRRPVVRARGLRHLPAAAAVRAEPSVENAVWNARLDLQPILRLGTLGGLARGQGSGGVALRAGGGARERQAVLQVVDAFLRGLNGCREGQRGAHSEFQLPTQKAKTGRSLSRS